MTDAVAVTAEDYSHEDTLWGHPKGLYVCFTTELWERFSFYGMKYLLVLYLTKYHLFTDQMGLNVLGAYAGLVYALPLIGGLIADRYLGMRKSVLFGGILLSLGHIMMAVEGYQAIFYAAGTTLVEDLTLASGQVLTAGIVLAEDITIRDTAALKVFYFALALIVMGVGYLKPNISTIVGKLYAPEDPRRDSGFTIFYMGINIGSFTATILCGWLGETFGWKYGFGAAGIGMIIGLFTFM
jgi:POT family proton-dependent oligopeptide transporter